MVVSGIPVAVPEAVRSRTRLLAQVEELYRCFDRAALEFTALRGGQPACVAKCGLCCLRTVPAVTEPEAAFATGSISQLAPPARLRVWQGLERWLTDPPPAGEGLEQTRALLNQPCPFLSPKSEGYGCRIYEARPLTCRAYSVTRTPELFCQRPRVGPERVARALGFLDNEWTQGLQQLVGRYYRVLRETVGITVSFMPTLVALQWRPQDVRRLPVPRAKLLSSTEPASLLFEHQLVELGWRVGTLATAATVDEAARFDRFSEAHRVPAKQPGARRLQEVGV